MILLNSVVFVPEAILAGFMRRLKEGTKTTGNNYNLLKTMCDFVCENLLCSRTIWLLIKSGSELERVKGIEPSY